MSGLQAHRSGSGALRVASGISTGQQGGGRGRWRSRRAGGGGGDMCVQTCLLLCDYCLAQPLQLAVTVHPDTLGFPTPPEQPSWRPSGQQPPPNSAPPQRTATCRGLPAHVSPVPPLPCLVTPQRSPSLPSFLQQQLTLFNIKFTLLHFIVACSCLEHCLSILGAF